MGVNAFVYSWFLQSKFRFKSLKIDKFIQLLMCVEVCNPKQNKFLLRDLQYTNGDCCFFFFCEVDNLPHSGCPQSVDLFYKSWKRVATCTQHLNGFTSQIREEMRREWANNRKRKSKSRANWTACFLRVPLTAQSGWLCHFLSAPLPLSLSLITSLRVKEDGGAGRRGEEGLVSTVMPDEREEGRFCSAAHLFLFSLLSPFSFSNSRSSFSSASSKTSLCSCFSSSH